MKNTSLVLYPELSEEIKNLVISTISDTRKKTLHLLTDIIQKKINSREKVNLNFICTHNSRRSHLSQVWAQAISANFRIPEVYCYSGGTEATSLFPMVASTLKETGFQIVIISDSENPVYGIKYGPNEPSVIGFSKIYNHPINPENNFTAIMTCSQADAGCPYIPGAENRIALPFEDPKEFDNFPEQAEKYSERSKQIATELFYIFSKITL